MIECCLGGCGGLVLLAEVFVLRTVVLVTLAGGFRHWFFLKRSNSPTSNFENRERSEHYHES